MFFFFMSQFNANVMNTTGLRTRSKISRNIIPISCMNLYILSMIRMRIYAAYRKSAEIYVTKSTQKIPTNTISLKINKNRKCFKRVHKIQSNQCGHLFSLGQLCDTLIHQGSIEVWTRSRSPCHFVPYQSGHVYFMIILYFFYQN